MWLPGKAPLGRFRCRIMPELAPLSRAPPLFNSRRCEQRGPSGLVCWPSMDLLPPPTHAEKHTPPCNVSLTRVRPRRFVPVRPSPRKDPRLTYLVAARRSDEKLRSFRAVAERHRKDPRSTDIQAIRNHCAKANLPAPSARIVTGYRPSPPCFFAGTTGTTGTLAANPHG